MKGLILKKGTMLDATLVTAKHAPPARAAGMGATHPKEPDAGWTKKGGKAYFGYKAHVGVDQGSGLVRSIDFTSAKINDSEVADGLICGDEASVYADKAYEKKGRRARLKAAGIKDRIMHRRHKHIARLPPWRAQRRAHHGRVHGLQPAPRRAAGRPVRGGVRLVLRIVSQSACRDRHRRPRAARKQPPLSSFNETPLFRRRIPWGEGTLRLRWKSNATSEFKLRNRAGEDDDDDGTDGRDDDLLDDLVADVELPAGRIEHEAANEGADQAGDQIAQDAATADNETREPARNDADHHDDDDLLGVHVHGYLLCDCRPARAPARRAFVSDVPTNQSQFDRLVHQRRACAICSSSARLAAQHAVCAFNS
jgi:IS5 family transposase